MEWTLSLNAAAGAGIAHAPRWRVWYAAARGIPRWLTPPSARRSYGSLLAWCHMLECSRHRAARGCRTSRVIALLARVAALSLATPQQQRGSLLSVRVATLLARQHRFIRLLPPPVYVVCSVTQRGDAIASAAGRSSIPV